MPKLYDAITLCAHTYNADQPIPAGWQKVLTSDSLAPGLADYPGYYAQAFVSADECVIVHRGTHFDTVATAAGNLSNDSSIALGMIPKDSTAALQFSQYVMQNFKNKKYQFVQVGHSLGGVHAHFCAVKLAHYAIAFDPPGSAEALAAHLKEVKITVTKQQLAKHYTFLSEPNLINDIYTQIGHVFQKSKDTLDIDNYLNCVVGTRKRHALKTLTQIIEQDSPDPIKLTMNPKKINNFVWLKEADSFQPEALACEPGYETPSIFHEQLKVHAKQGVLTILKDHKNDHVFLILESIQNNIWRLIKIDCVYSKETENNVIKKAKIRIAPTTVEHLKEYRKTHFRSSWPVTVEQIQRLEHLAAAEKARSERGEIEYYILGNASIAGSIGKSLDTVGSRASKEEMIKKYGDSSAGILLLPLLMSGHNCYSWAQAILIAIKLTPPKTLLSNFTELVVKAPSIVFNKNLLLRGDETMKKSFLDTIRDSSKESDLDAQNVLDVAAAVVSTAVPAAAPAVGVAKLGIDVAIAATPIVKDSVEDNCAENIEKVQSQSKECVASASQKLVEMRINQGPGSCEEECNEYLVKPALKGGLQGALYGLWNKHSDKQGALPYQRERILASILIAALSYVFAETTSIPSRLLLVSLVIAAVSALNADSIIPAFNPQLKNHTR